MRRAESEPNSGRQFEFKFEFGFEFEFGLKIESCEKQPIELDPVYYEIVRV